MLQEALRKILFNGGRFLRERARARDFYVGLTLLTFAFALLFWLIPFYVGRSSAHIAAPGVNPRFLPSLIALSLCVLSLLLIYNSPRTSKDRTRREEKQFSWVMIFWVPLFLGYYYGVKVIGMVPASIVALLLLMRMFGYRRWVLSIILTLGIVFLLFVFFEIIAHIPMPRGLLFGD